MEDEGITMSVKAPLPPPIRHHLPNKPSSIVANSILSSFTNNANHSTGHGDLSRRTSVVANPPHVIEKQVPPSFDLMNAFPVSYFKFRLDDRM